MTEALDIEQRIVGLQEWSRAELIDEWRRLYKKEVPPRISQNLMIRAIAYEWQKKVFGDLSKTDQNLLDRMVLAYTQDPSALRPSLQMKTGTRLRRLWQGKIYEVTATSDGFVYDGKKYGSLSEVARTITGTRWNGLVFFGLKRDSRGSHDKTTA